jgi:lipid-binding SYLF domain-containing protein
MRKRMICGLLAIWLPVVLSLSAWAGWDPTRKQKESAAVQETIARFKKADSSMLVFFDKAYGYVVFPSVGKGGFIVGGAHGDGWVHEKGIFIGRASIVQLTVGAQIGGQSFMEIIFFKDKAALDVFKQGNFKLNAQISAVAVTEGASKDGSYDHAVAVLTMPRKGLMAEATVGGQKFEFAPK